MTIFSTKTGATGVRVFALMAILSLAACAQNGRQIGYSVNICCPGDYPSYQAYGIATSELPGFLADYAVSEFEAAFSDKGLVRNDRVNDVVITLSYRHVNLNPEQENVDPFERRIEDDTMLRYVANIVVDIAESDSGTVVWSGQVNRIHTVMPGEYMHEERARPEFQAAFREMLSSYPSLKQ